MIKKQIINPFLPMNEYIPDGEPHVFGDRVYLFGSHDKEGGERFCMLDYVCYSAPVTDLTSWKCEGVIYRAEQDPESIRTGKRITLAAPDVVRGNDGRYYLYYTTDGFQHPISVAVCDSPAGEYEFCGTLKNADGTPFSKRIPFDPAVINDDGVIRLYYGWALHLTDTLLNRISFPLTAKVLFGKKKDDGYEGSIMGAYTVELEDDMLTVRTEPKLVAPSRMEAKGTGFEDHAFYEASSIRKIGDTYYFIWSSFVNHELCYATSRYPDKDFKYRGVIISNGDIGFEGRKPEDRLNTTGNNHGSIECINENWYVFYHRHTHNRSCSRQACAERIEILPDGTIPQVEMTNCGMNNGPLMADGKYPAAMACNLYGFKMGHIVNGISKVDRPFITHEGDERFITGIREGTVIGYKYFEFEGPTALRLIYRGDCKGTISVIIGDKKMCTIEVNKSDVWTIASTEANLLGTNSLNLKYIGEGAFDLLSITFDVKSNILNGAQQET